jgi:hypothetical protein
MLIKKDLEKIRLPHEFHIGIEIERAAASTRWHPGSPTSKALSPAGCAATAGPGQNQGCEKTLNSTSQKDQSILEYIL